MCIDFCWLFRYTIRIILNNKIWKMCKIRRKKPKLILFQVKFVFGRIIDYFYECILHWWVYFLCHEHSSMFIDIVQWMFNDFVKFLHLFFFLTTSNVFVCLQSLNEHAHARFSISPRQFCERFMANLNFWDGYSEIFVWGV